LVAIRCKDKTFQNIQAIIFDKDGTLASSELFLRNLGHKRSRLLDAKIPGVQDPLLMAFGLDGDRLNPAGLLAIGTRYENEIAAAAYVAETGRDWAEALEIVRSAFVEADSYMKRKAEETPLFAGARELIQMLTEADIRLGVVSSDTTSNVEDFVQHYDLAAYFQLRMGLDHLPGKPNPVIVQQACTALGVAPEASLWVGDAQIDIQLAIAGNVAGCIAVTWSGTHPAQLRNADVVIDRFEEIQIV
jgi:phosphoglycolate phosphatase